MMKELRSKSDEELLQLFVKLKGQLLQIRFLHANGELDKPHKILQVRQMIARVLTILHERHVDEKKINDVASVAILHQNVTKKSSKEAKHSSNEVHGENDKNQEDIVQSKQKTTKSATTSQHLESGSNRPSKKSTVSDKKAERKKSSNEKTGFKKVLKEKKKSNVK